MLRRVFFGLVLSSVVIASSTYTVAVIPVPSGYVNVSMSGINNSGQVTGNGNSGGPNPQPFIASPAGSTPIPVPSGWIWASVQALNDSGQVVGYGSDGSSGFPFAGTASGIAAIPSPPGWSGVVPAAINDSGQITGYGGSGVTTQAFIGTVSESIPIPLLAGFGEGFGYAINASGQVAGMAANQVGSFDVPFIGTSSGSSAVPVPTGWSYAVAYSINSTGRVAGFGANAQDHAQAYIGSASNSIAIPLPPGATDALVREGSMNDLGLVVGSSTVGSNNVGGWIWDATDGTMLLSALVPPGWNVTSAISISNTGLILAQASYNGGAVQFVELSPSGCNFSLTPPGISFGAAAGTSSVTVTTAIGCNWQAVSNNTWLTITAGSSGTGIGTVNINIDANTGPSSRVGTLIVGGQTFAVTQAAPPVSTPSLISPANVAMGVSLTPTLSWTAAIGATSYDVYFGISPTPPLVTNITAITYTPATLTSNTTYYWQVIAKNSVASAPSAIFSFTTFNSLCTFAVTPPAILIGNAGGSASVSVTAGSGCAWTATSNASWLTITAGGSGTGNGSISFSATSNAGRAQLAYISFANQRVGVMQGGSPTVQTFNDVPPTDPYFDYISVMATYGITLGCQASPPLYCTNSPVTRAEMAALLVRAYDVATGSPLTFPVTPYFQDVPASGVPDSIYYGDVQRLAQLGITLGCQSSPALFCPDQSVSQGEMAAFMIRSWMLLNNITVLTYPPAPLTDVPATDLYFSYVQKMVQLGFWTGCGGGSYCENSAVSRDQMAPMIMRAMMGAP